MIISQTSYIRCYLNMNLNCISQYLLDNKYPEKFIMKCVYLWVCMYMCINVHVCMHIYTYVCVYLCMCVFASMCVNVSMYVHVYVFVPVFNAFNFISMGTENTIHITAQILWRKKLKYSRRKVPNCRSTKRRKWYHYNIPLQYMFKVKQLSLVILTFDIK